MLRTHDGGLQVLGGIRGSCSSEVVGGRYPVQMTKRRKERKSATQHRSAFAFCDKGFKFFFSRATFALAAKAGPRPLYTDTIMITRALIPRIHLHRTQVQYMYVWICVSTAACLGSVVLETNNIRAQQQQAGVQLGELQGQQSAYASAASPHLSNPTHPPLGSAPKTCRLFVICFSHHGQAKLPPAILSSPLSEPRIASLSFATSLAALFRAGAGSGIAPEISRAGKVCHVVAIIEFAR
jgi:hypothetical protein